MQKRKDPPESENDNVPGSAPVLGRPSGKKQRQLNHKVQQYQLNKEQEARLGKACDTASWLIRIAQSTSQPSCLVVRSILTSELTDKRWTLLVDTKDRVPLRLVLAGAWVRALASRFLFSGQLVKHHPFLISSNGASLKSFPDSVAFASRRPMLQIIDVADLELGDVHQLKAGWLDDDAEELLSSEDARLEQNLEQIASTPSEETPASSPPPLLSSEAAAPLGDSTKRNVQPSPNASSLSPLRQSQDDRSSHTVSQGREETPEWYLSPAQKSKVHGGREQCNATVTQAGSNGGESIASGSSRPQDKANSTDDVGLRAMEERKIGKHWFKPIHMLSDDRRAYVSTIGVVTSAKKPRKSVNGNMDWTMAFRLRDVFPLGKLGKPITCNLFALELGDLPDLQDNDMVALSNIVVRDFGYGPQITGYVGKFGWKHLASSSGDISSSLAAQQVPSMEVDEELRLQHSFAVRDDAPVATPGRKKLLVSDIEPRKCFFDLEAVVLKKWDGEQPHVMVTDFTFNAHLGSWNDKYLPGAAKDEGEGERTPQLSREEMQRKSKGGYVYQIFFWGANVRKTEMMDLEEGMHVRFENIRAKVSPVGVLEGNMNAEDEDAPERFKSNARDKDGAKKFKLSTLDDESKSAQVLESRRREMAYLLKRE